MKTKSKSTISDCKMQEDMKRVIHNFFKHTGWIRRCLLQRVCHLGNRRWYRLTNGYGLESLGRLLGGLALIIYIETKNAPDEKEEYINDVLQLLKDILCVLIENYEETEKILEQFAAHKKRKQQHAS